MKLLYITNGINGAGGLERVLSVKASYLAEHYGYEVTILSLNGNHLRPFYTFSSKISMLSIATEGNPLQYARSYSNGIKETVTQVQPDVISVCDDGLKGFFLPVLLGKRCHLIYERHASIDLNFNKKYSSIISKSKKFFLHFLMRKMAKKFDVFVVLTKGNLKEWSSGNIKVIPNPISFYPIQSASLTKRKVIVVGSHSYNKGYDLLLQTWKKVIPLHPDWQLEIYGKSDENHTFVQLAKKLQLSASVTFFEPVQTIQEKYMEASIMVLPSRSEGFGMVLIEAMSCGVPSIAFDCPHGPADIIRDGQDGLLVKNGDIVALADALNRMMTSEVLRKEMGVAAKTNVQRFLPETILKQWDTLFKDLL